MHEIITNLLSRRIKLADNEEAIIQCIYYDTNSHELTYVVELANGTLRSVYEKDFRLQSLSGVTSR